jgi:hypothetical protein
MEAEAASPSLVDLIVGWHCMTLIMDDDVTKIDRKKEMVIIFVIFKERDSRETGKEKKCSFFERERERERKKEAKERERQTRIFYFYLFIS